MNLGIKDRLKQLSKKAGFNEHVHQKPEELIATLKFKLEKAEKMIASMRVNYTKDIINMQDQIQIAKHTKFHGFKFIEVKHFDPTDVLNDDIRELLNLKVDEMRNAFEMKLVDKDAAYMNLTKQVA